MRKKTNARLSLTAILFAATVSACPAPGVVGVPPTAARTLWITNGSVHSAALANNLLYIGGDFNFIGPPTGNGCAIDASTGSLPPGYDHLSHQVDGEILSAAPDGNGGWCIGGVFSHVGAVERNNIARIAADGSPHDWNPNANHAVRAIVVSGSTLYVGGDFSSTGGQARNRLAALNAATGAVLDWNPAANNDVYALQLQGTTLYAGGAFTTIGGEARNYIAALEAATGDASAWDPDANGLVRALAVGAGMVYAGGEFTVIGGDARNRIAALHPDTGQAESWDPNANGLVLALAVSGDRVYAGGYFTVIGGEP
ncbi:MAG: PQQ-binding-like beta-propeller repeat protein [Spirochaetales bacterium]|nr:PQQ-binding-like beta-propeller repeat protein [Spirochaetales bacterium]